MKKQNGDAWILGTRRAALAVAVSLYAAMVGAQTNSGSTAAPETNRGVMVLADVGAYGECPSGGGPGCTSQGGGRLGSGGFGVAAAGLGSTSTTGSPAGNGTSSTGAGASSSGGNSSANSGPGGV
ncbi:hypothetical protein F6X42_28415, partial [Paraburkholderia sp. WC7.3b]|nr:hypothetical protein [Paraburkholderia podalyriae]